MIFHFHLFAPRILQLAVLALSSFFPFRAYFNTAYLEELSLLATIPLAIKFVLNEIRQSVRVVLPCLVRPF